MKFKLSRNQSISLFITATLLILLTGCLGKSEQSSFNTGRTSTELIQKNLRTTILSRFIEKDQKVLEIPKTSEQQDKSKKVKSESAKLIAWRNSVNEQWINMTNEQMNMVCKMFYQGIIDENSTFAETFATTRKGLELQGTSIYSVKDAKILFDNRKTVQYPTPTVSTSLFVCQATVVLKLTNGAMTRPVNSTIGWNYYLDNGVQKWTISFSIKN